ncbi:hypothetical protein BDL97_06G105700 [Sphagnum fallax]|nr:hypothetical protein BDL97_06G105700 [Sphagnum fallax]
MMEVVQPEKKMFSLVPGDYKLLEEVGQGVSATVYRAVFEPLNEVVAIKSLDLERCNSNLDDICREAKTMSLISHPNVVKAYCSFVVDQSLWVVMPYMSGGSCLHIMKSAYPNGFDEPVIATMLKETLKALDYLHRHGDIHRDVKAGNILVDGNGAVKLGDFGVSACMFDTGDRQRSRNTFVGTPCWMAPEVMEQLHGYDFKADIWSFGITALELAHGHAPFSKYPPMKVLLMTLQNAPPGLDLERDKKFSKSFKEMIAMCLVKDPSKRPSAEKLLRHSFFKHARSFDYIARHVLEGLPPLGERVKNLKITDANRLAQKKMPFDEQEEKSQNEYKRGVSSWNFNLEDLKKQAALIQDDEENPFPKTVIEVEEVLKQPAAAAAGGGEDESADTSPKFPLSSPPQPSLSRESSLDMLQQLPVTIHSIVAETAANDGAERVTRVRSGPLPNPVQLKSATANGSKGRFDVFDDNSDLESPGWHGSPKDTLKTTTEEQDQPLKQQEREERDHRKTEERELRENSREQRRNEDRDRVDDAFLASSGSLVPDRASLPSARGGREEDRERDREKDHRQVGRTGEEPVRSLRRERSFSGSLTSTAERAVPDYRPANGVQAVTSKPVAGNKESTEEKMKLQAQKGPILQKGRFSVTSDDVNLEDPHHASGRRIPVPQGLQHQPFTAQQPPPPPPPPTLPSPNINLTTPIAALIPQLQHILQQGQRQQEDLMNLVNCLSPNDAANFQNLHSFSRYSRGSSASFAGDFLMDIATDRERDLLHQVSELQSRMASLVDELQTVKLRNVGLERQLNAIYNKEEEERIRKEEAAKEDG